MLLTRGGKTENTNLAVILLVIENFCRHYCQKAKVLQNPYEKKVM
jgi:hypothetical protein